MVMIAFVHCGPAPLPYWIRDTLELTIRVAPKSEIVVLANAQGNRTMKIEASDPQRSDESDSRHSAWPGIEKGQA
jgi:hypothetical protein